MRRRYFKGSQGAIAARDTTLKPPHEYGPSAYLTLGGVRALVLYSSAEVSEGHDTKIRSDAPTDRIL